MSFLLRAGISGLDSWVNNGASFNVHANLAARGLGTVSFSSAMRSLKTGPWMQARLAGAGTPHWIQSTNL